MTATDPKRPARVFDNFTLLEMEIDQEERLEMTLPTLFEIIYGVGE